MAIRHYRNYYSGTYYLGGEPIVEREEIMGFDNNMWDWYWISTKRFTGGVAVSNISNTINISPPIFKKFLGQHIENLKKWVKKIDNEAIIERLNGE